MAPPLISRSPSTDSAKPRQAMSERFKTAWHTTRHHLKKHVGVGVMCAVAYFDPGNWSVDLQAGSQFGYKLLTVVLGAGLIAVLLQVLACRLGCVTGLDLASHCRLLLYNHPRFPRLVRWVFLYPLYVISEIAIISTDIAELIGSAIGLCLIFPQLPLWAGVLLTGTDVLFILLLGDTSKGGNRPARLFELVIVVLVLIVFICFVILIVKVGPHWPTVFEGYIPSKSLVESSGLYASIGILGATVMPHALYLGSYLATQDRVSNGPSPSTTLPSTSSISTPRRSWKAYFKGLFYVQRVWRGEPDPDLGMRDFRSPYGERDNNTYGFIRAHLSHGLTDIVMSLLGFAVAINSAILVLAGAVYFYGQTQNTSDGTVGLFDAHDLIRDILGAPAAFMFALALLCAGQTASITATLAGQIVSEGFIEWRISPILRRLITRLIGLIPSLIVATSIGKPGIDSVLVISQVILSVVLPFVMFPLVWLTSSKLVMRVKRPSSEQDRSTSGSKVIMIGTGIAQGQCEDGCAVPELAAMTSTIENGRLPKVIIEEVSIDIKKETDAMSITEEEEQWVDYSSGWFVTCLGYILWLGILVANGYLLITL